MEETISPKERAALQRERLNSQIERVKRNLPALGHRFAEHGVGRQPLTHLEELSSWPMMTKADLIAAYPMALFGVPRQAVVRLQGSSGTHGKPTLVGYSQDDLAMWAEVVARCLVLVGAESGQMLHNAYGYGLFTGGLGLHGGAERLGLTVMPASGGVTSRQCLLLEDLRPDGLACTPSYALNIAEHLIQNHKDPRHLGLKWAILGAEPWTEEMRREIEKEFGCDACDIYGLSEVIGPGVAAECHQAKDGLHVHEDHFLVEVIDPKSGQVLADGEDGELVFTTLTRQVSPVIRYRTGDIASLNHEPCRCGRTTVRMSRIKGRVDDMFVLRGVNIFPSEIERLVLAQGQLAPVYVLRLTQSAALAELTVEVEALPAADAEAAVRQLQHQLHDAFGVRVAVLAKEPGSLPRSEGKAKRLIDERTST
ncbi:MAG: phenylacetate--CoA ligase family protein [Sulfobacillus sp.]